MAAQDKQWECRYENNICHLELRLESPITLQDDETRKNYWDASAGKRVENIRNCDIFVEDFHFLIYVDVQLFQFHSKHQLDVKDMKNLILRYDSKQRCFQIDLPCLPQSDDELTLEKLSLPEKGELDKKSCKGASELDKLNLWQLKRITDGCRLQLDDNTEQLHFMANFDYGFAGKFQGKIYGSDQSEISQIARIPSPQSCSPLQRSIDREIDEMKNFSREQYKLNFIELQVPEGHDDPMKFCINFNEITLTKDEQSLLHNLTCKPSDLHMPDSYSQAQVDCGLINILLAICYDVRSTSNEPTCESAWTRSVLSATLTYFEPFDCLKVVVISFLRRSLVYPLYRNYDFGCLCVQDCIDALQKSPAWILKQLLATYDIFLTSYPSRELFNHYFIEDYIRYVSNGMPCTVSHLQMLARNLKNVLLDVNKKQLQFDLFDIEKELLKELVEDIHLNNTASEEEDSYEDDSDEIDDSEDNDVDDDGTESDEDEQELSSVSDAEEMNGIEQHVGALKI